MFVWLLITVITGLVPRPLCQGERLRPTYSPANVALSSTSGQACNLPSDTGSEIIKHPLELGQNNMIYVRLESHKPGGFGGLSFLSASPQACRGTVAGCWAFTLVASAELWSLEMVRVYTLMWCKHSRGGQKKTQGCGKMAPGCGEDVLPMFTV